MIRKYFVCNYKISQKCQWCNTNMTISFYCALKMVTIDNRFTYTWPSFSGVGCEAVLPQLLLHAVLNKCNTHRFRYVMRKNIIPRIRINIFTSFKKQPIHRILLTSNAQLQRINLLGWKSGQSQKRWAYANKHIRMVAGCKWDWVYLVQTCGAFSPSWAFAVINVNFFLHLNERATFNCSFS